MITYSIDDVWGADLVDMREWKGHNKSYNHLLTVIDVLSKYAWGVPLKDRRGETVTEALSSIINESGRKPNNL